jgi:hypothetical protein
VLDGAYAEFVEGYDGGAEIASRRENVVMTRTFSKVYGLGGLRIGWGYGPKAIIEQLLDARGGLALLEHRVDAELLREVKDAVDLVGRHIEQRGDFADAVVVDPAVLVLDEFQRFDTGRATPLVQARFGFDRYSQCFVHHRSKSANT